LKQFICDDDRVRLGRDIDERSVKIKKEGVAIGLFRVAGNSGISL
jgi:hypothetical protein